MGLEFLSVWGLALGREDLEHHQNKSFWTSFDLVLEETVSLLPHFIGCESLKPAQIQE